MIVKAKSTKEHAALMVSDILRTYDEAIANLSKLTNDGTRILAWDYGMGVMVSSAGTPAPVDLWRATPIPALPQEWVGNGIFNGAKVQAASVDRYAAAQKYLGELREYRARMAEKMEAA